MSKTLTATFAFALLSATAFGGSAALASGGDGEYYQGASREPVQQLMVDNYSTQSIENPNATQDAGENAPGDREYFQGAEMDR
jgi:hypothetical protein